MKAKFSDVILYVQNVKNLRKFYVENFDFKVLEEDDIWVLLNAGSVNIGFHKIGEKYLKSIDPNHQFDNNTKIVFEIDIDIETARKELISKGVSMREIKTFENYDFMLCDGTDSEGNIFQLKAKKTTSI